MPSAPCNFYIPPTVLTPIPVLSYGAAMPRSRPKLPDTPESTWRLFPSEAAKQPSVVTVRDARGQLIATIDPLTRERRTPAGRLMATLTPQGFNAYLTDYHFPAQHPPVSIAPRGVPQPDYGPTLRRDRDKRA